MGKLKRLSETEAEVMQVIWAQDSPATVTELLAVFSGSKGWKTSTLSTILDRLIDKGFLTKSLRGKVNYYTPLLTFEMYGRLEAVSLLSSLYGGSVKNLVASLADGGADGGGISKQELDELKAWFRDMEGRE